MNTITGAGTAPFTAIVAYSPLVCVVRGSTPPLRAVTSNGGKGGPGGPGGPVAILPIAP